MRFPLIVLGAAMQIFVLFSPCALADKTLLPSRPDFTGTAFFISADGVAVTNYHVIAQSKHILLFDPHKENMVEAHILAADPANDLVLLKADIRSKPLPLENRFKLRRGEEVLTLGFPNPSVQGTLQKASFGRINSATGLSDDPRLVQIDAPLQPGNSGGPLLNFRGMVVGVAFARLKGAYQNVGYAVKVDYLRQLLDKAGVNILPPRVSRRALSEADVVERSQDAVVMVLGYKDAGQGGRSGTSSAPPQNDNIDFAAMRRAAQAGDVRAQNLLGVMYAEGRGGAPKDERKAFEWFKKAAEQGNASAQHNLAVIYTTGNGALKDYFLAFEWYKKAAEQGHVIAQHNLGVIYASGRGTSKNDRKAVEWYRKAAEQGHAPAQNNLGLMYDNGRGVSKDYRQAFEWYKKAAEQGHAVAQNNLGLMYKEGEGTSKDEQKAAAWYKKAAEQGHSVAQNNLGVMYENGEGVPKDMLQAMTWYSKAAEQGNIQGQFNLGGLYFMGLGTGKDEGTGCAWWQKAAEQGHNQALEFYDNLCSEHGSLARGTDGVNTK
ncbi:MAG: trypsin-like peptidase domain-containing protein [Deltaproteobacteria bacterium]|jgi:TPR repeat protein|nr:trypsin-like peptidase domain-containing protein [Deltaproteobacteria bacterium]